MKPREEQMKTAHELAREAAKVYADNVGDFVERGLTLEMKGRFDEDGQFYVILVVYPSVDDKAWNDAYNCAFCYTTAEIYTAIGLLREKLNRDYFGDVILPNQK